MGNAHSVPGTHSVKSPSGARQEPVRSPSGVCQESVRSLSGVCQESVKSLSGVRQDVRLARRIPRNVRTTPPQKMGLVGSLKMSIPAKIFKRT